MAKPLYGRADHSLAVRPLLERHAVGAEAMSCEEPSPLSLQLVSSQLPRDVLQLSESCSNRPLLAPEGDGAANREAVLDAHRAVLVRENLSERDGRQVTVLNGVVEVHAPWAFIPA